MICFLLIKLIKKLFELIKRHPKEVIAGAAIIGTGLTAAGGIKVKKANKINEKASQIQKNAVERHKKEREKTEQRLMVLGKIKGQVIQSFDYFSQVINRIQGKPKFKKIDTGMIKMKKIELEDFKVLSENYRLAVNTAGGLVGGAGLGLALFGANIVVMAPALVLGGALFCVQGINLEKKAVNNLNEAKKLKNSIDETCIYYGKICNSVDKLIDCINIVYRIYIDELNYLNQLTRKVNKYKYFSKRDKILLQNCIRLAKILFVICNLKLVEESKNEEEIGKVYTKEVDETVKKAYECVNKIPK